MKFNCVVIYIKGLGDKANYKQPNNVINIPRYLKKIMHLREVVSILRI